MKALLLVLAIQAQEDLPGLLERLDDDSIDARSEALNEIVRRGKAALPALEAAAARAGGERRERLREAMRLIMERDRLRAVLPPPSRVTLEARDRPLKEVLEALGRQGRTPIQVGDLGERKVSVSLASAPFWTALDEVCRASGEVFYELREERVEVRAERYAALPRHVSDVFSVRLERLEFTRGGVFDAPDMTEQTMASVRLAWEKGAAPARATLRVRELVDDQGTSLLDAPGGEDPELLVQIVPAGPELSETFNLYAGKVPAEGAAKLARFRFSIDCEYPLEHAGVTFAQPEGAAGSVEKCEKFTVHLQKFVRAGGTVKIELGVTLENPEEPFVPLQAVRVRAQDGKEYATELYGSSGSEKSVTYFLRSAVPEKVAIKELAVRVPSRTHTERISVELKDIPIR